MQHLLKDQIDAISPISDEEFAYILSHFVAKKLKKHAFLVQQGDQVKYDACILCFSLS